MAAALSVGGCVFGGGSGGDPDPDAGVVDDRPRFDSGHLFRIPIAVAPTAGDGLFDFVLGINSDRNTGIAAEARDDGADLFLTESDGVTPVPFELERFDVATGAFTLWVNMSPLESTTLYLYYGSPDDAGINPDIWPSSYRAVWHGGMGGQGAIDSSKSGLAASPTKAALPSSIDGVAGLAFDFADPADAARFEVTSASPVTFAADSFTFSAWVRIGPSPAGRPWHFGGEATASPGYGIDFTQAIARAALSDANSTYVADFGAVSGMVGDWVHLVAAVDRTGDSIQTYVNGSPANSGAILDGANLTPSAPARLGGPDSSLFDGQLDEVRITTGVPAAIRVQAEYENLTNETFVVIGDAESPES